MRDGRPVTYVPCDGCTLCCVNRQLVVLFPDHGDDPANYQTQQVGKWTALDFKPNGDCIHLGPGGCEVYDRRPVVCKAFDCGDQFRQHTRAERRRMVKAGMMDAAILERGREIERVRSQGSQLADPDFERRPGTDGPLRAVRHEARAAQAVEQGQEPPDPQAR
jgi:Fe-S-cluster containining protein